MGLGFTLLGHVDLVLIDEGARLRVPFAELGVPPEAASSLLLPERMGWQPRPRPSWPRSGSTPTRPWRPGWPCGSARPGTVLAETMALATRIASFPPHAARRDQAPHDGGPPARRHRRPPA